MKDYLIAGVRVQMETFGRTLEQAKPYEIDTDGEPDIVIRTNPEAFQKEHPHLDLEQSEYLCSGGQFYRQLLLHGGMLVHASAVVKDGYAYLFSAPCGTGKSTHTKLWQTVFGEEVQILNDDKPAIRREDGRWYAYGTPWSGKTAKNLNIRVPLGGICMLRRGQTNEIAPFGGVMAVHDILEQTARPALANGRGILLDLLGDLIEQVPVWRMQCNMEPEAAMVSHTAMSEEANKRFGGK